MPSITIPASLDDIEMTAKLSITPEGMTATRTALVDFDEYKAAVNLMFGSLGVVGGVLIPIIGANTWPGIPFLRATSVDVEYFGKCVASDWELGPVAEHVKLTIGYSTKDQGDDDDNHDQPEDEVWLIQSVDYNCDIITIPVKVESVLEVSAHTPRGDTPAHTVSREVKKFIRIPTVTYTGTLPAVREPKWDTINAKVGKINTDVIFRGPAGTVLFDGLNGEREARNLDAVRMWKIATKMIYQRHGWNKVLHPDTLEWVDAAALNGGNRPYESTTLRDILKAS